MEYTIEDTFDVSAERYWSIFFSDAFNAGLWPAIDIEWQLIKLDRRGEGRSLVIEREARLRPHREVPRLLQSIVNGAISYVETNRFEAATNAMHTNTVPNFMADRIDNHGVYGLEVLGPERVKRVWKGTCVARIPVLGGRIESFLVEQIRDSYRKTTDFTRQWIREHASDGPTG